MINQPGGGQGRVASGGNPAERTHTPAEQTQAHTPAEQTQAHTPAEQTQALNTAAAATGGSADQTQVLGVPGRSATSGPHWAQASAGPVAGQGAARERNQAQGSSGPGEQTEVLGPVGNRAAASAAPKAAGEPPRASGGPGEQTQVLGPVAGAPQAPSAAGRAGSVAPSIRPVSDQGLVGGPDAAGGAGRASVPPSAPQPGTGAGTLHQSAGAAGAGAVHQSAGAAGAGTVNQSAGAGARHQSAGAGGQHQSAGAGTLHQSAGAAGAGMLQQAGGGGSAGTVIQPGGGAGAGTSGGDRREEAGPRRSRTKLVSALAVLMLLALVAAVGLVVRPGPVDEWLGATPTTAPTSVPITPEPSPTPVLVAAEAAGVTPDTAAVKAALDPLVGAAALGSTVHVSVLDVASETVLYQRNADRMVTPASTTKVLTAATALAARGPAYRFQTRVVAGANPGEVVIIGGGDVTLGVNAKRLFPGAARLDKLAEQVKKALGGTKPTKVLVDTSLFSGPETAPGWGSGDIGAGQVARIQALMTNGGRVQPVHNDFGGDPRFADPALAAGKAFAKFLGVTAVGRGKAPAAAAGVTPSAGASLEAGAGLAAGTELGMVESPPLVQVVEWMLQMSDNVLAEAIGRQVALAAGQPASFAGAAGAMSAKLTELGLPADEADLYDASGLSTRNNISPDLLVQTLSLAAGGEQAALSNMFNGLPVAGWSGTMRTRFVTPSPNQSAQGIVRAKTGTLSGVNTLAGVLITKDGRVLAFAIMAKGGANAVTARSALDKVAARLVQCGC
ncbi:D-alanyl-D-alanine carboxypeptidase/D-alanyl-D-alanine-endopeptidase [Actinoplanes sp. NBC_00393]|uniref:D-alanyl-D-alanine carboxypeptidase/D-alanyl-D-alanine endopeptidase n=1 Tax=Actinoplanes sp. NBC_00393 TaxID=2975953 RepID=UPI002E1FF850